MITQEAEMLTYMFTEVQASHDGVEYINGILIGFDQACEEGSSFMVRTSKHNYSHYRYCHAFDTKKPLR